MCVCVCVYEGLGVGRLFTTCSRCVLKEICLQGVSLRGGGGL